MIKRMFHVLYDTSEDQPGQEADVTFDESQYVEDTKDVPAADVSTDHQSYADEDFLDELLTEDAL